MKTFRILSNVLLCAVALLISSCSSSDDADNGTVNGEPLSVLRAVQDDGVSTFAVSNICPVLIATDPLTADEIEFLYAIREDEKLSRDIYTAFAVQYPTAFQFSRFAAAEATHIAAIETLLTYYEIEFPILGDAGVFVDAGRQARYNDLLGKGSTLQGAFEAMAALEEENVSVYKAVEANIVNANIKLIVANMIKASSNHLKSVVRQLTLLGISYTPIYLDQATFDAIINSPFGQGNRYGQQNGMGNGSGNTNSQKGNMGQGKKGNVNNSGTCTGTANGGVPGANAGKGQAGKGYRGGR